MASFWLVRRKTARRLHLDSEEVGPVALDRKLVGLEARQVQREGVRHFLLDIPVLRELYLDFVSSCPRRSGAPRTPEGVPDPCRAIFEM